MSIPLMIERGEPLRVKMKSLSRRRLMSLLAGNTLACGVLADEPIVRIDRVESISAPVRRLVQPIATRQVQLRPISADFRDTIIRAIATDPSGEIRRGCRRRSRDSDHEDRNIGSDSSSHRSLGSDPNLGFQFDGESVGLGR